MTLPHACTQALAVSYLPRVVLARKSLTLEVGLCCQGIAVLGPFPLSLKWQPHGVWDALVCVCVDEGWWERGVVWSG